MSLHLRVAYPLIARKQDTRVDTAPLYAQIRARRANANRTGQSSTKVQSTFGADLQFGDDNL